MDSSQTRKRKTAIETGAAIGSDYVVCGIHWLPQTVLCGEQIGNEAAARLL
ncbi:MAG: hypothetical protein ACR2IB_07900 [Pyrinomonadaceae bacterium]